MTLCVMCVCVYPRDGEGEKNTIMMEKTIKEVETDKNESRMKGKKILKNHLRQITVHLQTSLQKKWDVLEAIASMV